MGKNLGNLKFFGILMIMKAAYVWVLRDLVKKAVEDPDSEWDETVMEIMDRLFGYEEQK